MVTLKGVQMSFWGVLIFKKGHTFVFFETVTAGRSAPQVEQVLQQLPGYCTEERK